MTELKPTTKWENKDYWTQQAIVGHRWQVHAAKEFKKEGFNVHVPILRICQDPKKVDEFSDQGDIFVSVKGASRPLIFECKSRDLNFTDIASFPFKTIICDRVTTWKRKKEKGVAPFCILVISQITGKIIVIPCDTENQWGVETIKDKKRSTPESPYIREYYLISKDHMREWSALIKYMKILP